MRHKYALSLVLIVIFISPALSNTDTMLARNSGGTSFPNMNNSFMQSADYQSGTGPSLPIILSGIATDRYSGTLQIDASTSDIHTITLDDGWSGSNLQTRIDSLSMEISDALINPSWNAYHPEKWLVGTTSYYGEDVYVPDGWTLVKNEMHESAHPHSGDWENNFASTGGYENSPRYRYEAIIDSTSAASDELYFSQLVNAPWREIYSAEISFMYYVIPGYNTSSLMNLFFRFAGIERTYTVFEVGDPTGVWLQATAILTAADLASVSLPDALLFDIGMGTDLTGASPQIQFRAYIDEIKLTMNVRPFPEQIDLKVNGTAVIGATQGSIYPYLPDDSNRDAEDNTANGIDLDGWPWGSGSPGILYVGAWGSAWTDASPYQSGFQFPLSIPQGAAITSAYFEVEPISETAITSTRIYAAGQNSSGLPIENFTTGLPNLEDRYNWVDTSVAWEVTDWLGPVRIRQRSPDIAPLIQAIVSDSNWDSSQYACLMLDYMWSSNYQAEWGIKGSSGTNNYLQDELARLFVEYMIPLPEDTVYFMQHEKDITIDHNQVSGTLSNFPVLIDITDTDLKTDVQPDGDDIIFKLGDESLDFEIELFDQDYSPTHARLVAWVKIPILSATQDTVITMAYGNPNAGPSSSTKVWDEYETVHHLADDPSGIVYDSTSNNYDGTSFGGMTSDDLVSGVAGQGINFDYDSVTIPNSDMINIGQIYTDDWTSFTVSLWMYVDLNRDSRVFSKSPSTTSTAHIITTRFASLTPTARLRTDYGGITTNANTSFSLGSWQYISWSWYASTSTSDLNVVGYMNALPVIQVSRTGTNLYDSNDVFVIANNNMATDASNERFFDGMLDEIRLTRSIRSFAWIETEYNNQANPASFVSVGTERAIQSTWTDAESTTVRFSTTSPIPVSIFPIVTMDIVGGGQSLDENMEEGTSFYVANDTVVEWTANVLVSPPVDAESLNVRIGYPLTEWKPITVTNPIGQVKTYGTDWTFHDGSVVIYSDAVDIWGVWTIGFNSWNYVYDLKLGPSGQSNYETYTFNVDDNAEFNISSPWIENARTGLVLTAPDNSIWYTNYVTTGVPGTTWDIPSFAYRMQLTIPAAQVDYTVSNFPLLVSFADTDFQTKVQADGDDFVFVQNGKVLAHEIDRFDQSTGRLVAWVQANLSSSVDNTLLLYYGNPVIGSTESPETLWSDGYEAVWLLNEDVTDEGSSGLHFDSTSNGYIGNQFGNSRTTGIVNGYGQNFDGNDWIEINSTQNLNPTGDVTISGWFYIASTWSATSSPSRVLAAKYLDGDYNFHIALTGSDYTETGFTSAGSLVFGFEINGQEWVKWTTRVSWAAGWYHFACVMDADTPSNNKIYINGADNTDAGSSGGAASINMAFNGNWGIGGGYVDTSEFPTAQAFHTGRVDELRIATTPRAVGWYAVEYDNVANIGAFIGRGTEESRTSPQHTLSKIIDSTAPAGLWTASVYYNDTGSTVSYGTGLFERNFIVKHDSSLTIINPADAVGDKTAYGVAGEILYIEMELTDDANSNKIAGAVVKMNWSVSGTPTELTLNDIGNGRYGKSVNTSDLDVAGKYRININSYHQYYNNATDYFDLELYHTTELDFTDVDTTPVGFDFTATLIFEDSYNGVPITGATIAFENGTLVNVVAEGAGRYNISLNTGGLSYGDHVFVFKATKAGSYLEESTVTITFTLRKHFTSVSVVSDLVTPYGDPTPVTVIIVDTDTGLALATTSNVNSWSFTSSYSPISETNPTDFAVSLTTGGWDVGTEPVTLSVSMSGIYHNPLNYLFDIQIRNHYTSVTVIGDLISPYGTTTFLTIVIVDTDTDTMLSASDVSSFLLNPASYSDHPESSPTDLIVDLDTSAWAVGTETVTLSVVMSGNYNNPVNYQFDIQIRNHYTSVTVIGDLITPYGQSTPLTLVITDLDTGLTLTSTSVSSFTFTPSTYGSQSDPSPSDLDFILDTSLWSVATETVTLSVVMSGNYNNPTNYQFDIQIRNHYTSVTVVGDFITPYGQSTQLTIIIRDTDTGDSLSASDVSSFLLNPASYSDHPESSPTDLIVDLDTSAWAVGTETVTLSVVMNGNYNNPDNYQFNIQIRNHYTSVTVIGDLITPYGEMTTLTIVIRDSDTGDTLTASDVSGFILNPASYGDTQETNPTDLIVVLDTSTWAVGTETVTLSVVMTGNFYNPSNYVFDIEIRNHYTSVTIKGNLETPYGNLTQLTIVITDLDSGITLSATDVSSFSFSSSYGSEGESSPSDLLYSLGTSTWLVEDVSVTLSLVMTGNYEDPVDYVFTITIRSVTTHITNEPGDYRYPTGDDFQVIVTVNVSEQGSLYGDPITGLLQGEFSIANTTHIIPIKEFHDLTNGRYNITIDASYFPEGDYTIFITVTPADNRYAESHMILIFEYRPARSELSSPDRAAVTPYNTDFDVTLTFLDIDRNQGIEGAIITAIGITIYNQQNLGSGVYQVTVDVSGLAKGEHLYQLTADQVGYEPQTISFKVVIRIAFTYAIPSVGALDIPVGDDPVFYVEYWDIDHDLPVTDEAPFLAASTWIHSVTITYIPAQERYRVTFITFDDDELRQNFVVSFNFSKGENYQFGLFNISITIRTHNTDFRLVSAIEPVSYTSNISISLFFGDIDSGEGIASQYVSHRVWNGTVNVISYLFNVTGQPGYYTIIVPAQQFGGLGLQNFTIYFNWTGPVSTYKDSYLFAAANILGEDSRLTLVVTAEPTPYLENMTYTLFYSAVNGTGIANITGHVYIFVEFVGETVDLNQVEIWEVNPVTDRGKYSIRFNTDLFGKTGLIYMKVYINWAKGVEPFYSNRTDTISVRILPRDTLVSISPPIQTAYGVNATFSFTFDDVTGALNVPIANDAKLTITISLSDYSITYYDPTKTFTVSFDTSQFGALGTQGFTLDVRWEGTPFYANQTGRAISVRVIARQTVLDYQTPSPTQYLDNVTFSVTWTDVAETAAGIEGATITLYDGASLLPSVYYTVYEIGSGAYNVVLNTTYKTNPGTYNIIVNITSTQFYYVSRVDTRSFTIRYRSTITSSEPVTSVPYSSPITTILYYQDIITLDIIGNDSSLVAFEILNGSSWIYVIDWNPSMGYYELTVETSNQLSLAIGSVYSLHINMSYAFSTPFYKFDDAYITFEIRSRASSLERQEAPVPTPYLNNVSFTVYYSDADDLSPITSANIFILKGVTPLVYGTDYFYSHVGGGVFEVIVQTTALDGIGVTTVTVQVEWIGGAPFHDDADIDIDLSVTRRPTNVEVITPPVQTPYLENVSFTVSFIDIETGQELQATKDLVTIYNDLIMLNPSEFSMTQIGAGYTYEISISSTVLSDGLVKNRIISVQIDWPDSPNYYKDDSSSTKATTIARSTYVSVDRPLNTPYGENATFTFSFVDSTTLPEVLVVFSSEMSILTNLTESPSLSYDVASHIFTMSFNTAQFGDVGLAIFYINVTWAGSPYYANKTLQLVYFTITMRQTQVNFDAPAPTPYGDFVTFDVSYIDISGVTEVGIPDATLSIYYLGVQIPGAYYTLTPDGLGNFEISLDTGYFSVPGFYNLNVSIVYTGGYFRNDASAVRTLNVRFRTTILSANPVGQVGYETQIDITLAYQDILTLANIDDTFTSFSILNDTGTPWVYTITWRPATSDYLVVITTIGQTTLTLGDHALWLNMSYAYVDPFYRWDDVYVHFTIRTRTSALDLQEAAIPAPFGENASFVVYYWDADVTAGISGADFILNSGVLTLDVNFFVVEDEPGVYTIYIDSSALGSLGTHSINVTAVWPGGAPYHNNAQRLVSVKSIERTASVDILEPANQPRYLDNMTFTFAYVDAISGLQISGIASNYVLIYSNGTLLASNQYVLTPVGSIFIVSINSTVLSTKLVKDFNITVFVNWPVTTSPFYTDDGTSMKVSTTQRIILVEPQQIETTPVKDRMNITFFLTDEDNDNPVSGAIIIFRCVNPVRILSEGSEYTLIESLPGKYTISIDTNALVFGPSDIGNFVFELEVQWNQANAPYYKNRSPIKLNGGVDLIWSNMQAGVPTPSSVQITGNVTVEVTLTDLDHDQGVNLPISVFEVHYYGTSIVPSPMTIQYLGLGVYSIEFSTGDLNEFGSHSLNITIDYYPYTTMSVNPSFTVERISTSLVPIGESEIALNWTEQVRIVVDYRDLLNLNSTSGAIVTWTYGPFSGNFSEIIPAGTYEAYIDTSLQDSGTRVVQVRAEKDKYKIAATTFTLIVLSLPSELVIDSPELAFEHPRGDPIDVVVYLTDEYNGGIMIESGISEVYLMFLGKRYDLIQNSTDYTWYTTLLPDATATLQPGIIYSARVIASATNYDPASAVFKMDLQATSTTIYLVTPTMTRMDAVYNNMTTFYLNFTESESGLTINNATIEWIDSAFEINETFTFNPISGLWELTFNTSKMAFGTWGVTFHGIPDDSNLAEDYVDLAITIRKIKTEVVSPIPSVIYWGWIGNLTFYYHDIDFDKGINNATAQYQWGPFSGDAIDLGNGYYSILINTTYLETGIRYPVTIDFDKLNYQVSTGSISLIIEEVPTELTLSTPTDNQIDNHTDDLEIPFGDAILISFFYNDTDDSDGYVGGLVEAAVTVIVYGGGIVSSITFDAMDFGNGTYYFVFDSTADELFELQPGVPRALPNSPFFIRISVDLRNRQSHSDIPITITVIERPTVLEFSSDNIIDGTISMYYGETIDVYVYYYESWLNVPGEGITNAKFTVTSERALVQIVSNRSTTDPGVYVLTIRVDAPLVPVGIDTQYVDLTITLSLDNYEQKELELSVTIIPTEEQKTMGTVISYATPLLFLVFLIGVLWTRYFSIPKRLRQINSQIKALQKGKIPKPITDSKTRQQLVADLFNDTFQKLAITRVSTDMPEASVPIEIPEIRELLIQLSILTNLSPEELDEFNADISKMKMSEQAAFVKEVIMQEAIRAARSRGKTVEEILEEVAIEASRRVSAPEEVEEISEAEKEAPEDRIFLVEEEAKEPEVTIETPEVEEKQLGEKLSQFELQELKADLLKKGVPLHEIDMIIEQASRLPRELVDELIKSLGIED